MEPMHSPVHRMADPAVRVRVAFMTACLVALAWIAITLLGRPAGPFTRTELPDVAGLPISVPQIVDLLPPQTSVVPAPDGAGVDDGR